MQPDFRLARFRGRFAVVFYEGSRRFRLSLRTDDRDEARRRLAEFIEDYKAQKHPRRLTVGWIFRAYLNDRPNDRADHAWKAMKPTFDDLLCGQINEAACREYEKDRGAAIGTVHTELGYLQTALNWAVKQGYMERAPHVWRPPKPRPKNVHLTRDEARNLVHAAQMPHIKLFIELALATGGRMAALLDLTWDRVDFERGVIQLDDPERDRTRKGRATVPVTDRAKEALKKAREGAQSDYVVEWGGAKVGNIKKGLAQASRRADLGKQVTAHALRHTAAVWMIEAGASIDEVAQYLGHTDTRITFRAYARYSPRHLRRAAQALEF